MSIPQVTIKEISGKEKPAALVQFGVPLPRGQYFNDRDLRLVRYDNRTSKLQHDHYDIHAKITTSSLWPDSSIKWCLIKARINLQPNEVLKLEVIRTNTAPNKLQCTPTCITETESQIEIRTKNYTHSIDKKHFTFFDTRANGDNKRLTTGLCTLCVDETDSTGFLTGEITGFEHLTSPTPECPISSTVTLNGYFRQEGDTAAMFTSRLEFFHADDLIRCIVTLHNPHAARHQSGLWDLGDPNSLLLDSFTIGCQLSEKGEVEYKSGRLSDWQSAGDNFLLYQGSSGGNHWDSPSHKNLNNIVPLDTKGYICTQDDDTVEKGDRAEPSLHISSGQHKISVHVPDFWQNFPGSLEYCNDFIRIGLFPEQFSDKTELQAGEKKTRTFYISFGNERDSLACFQTPPEVQLNPEWVQHTGVFDFLQYKPVDDPLQQVISLGLTSDNNFFAKREMIDEYGWRNFGDIYADHETDGYKGDELFISHYNNQYDPIYGFLKQYAQTGKPEWFTLANDLARHVCDIDIYHTRYDKEEYNGGLFWHTDHYLDAATSSHRSYSKYHKQDAYMDHAGGGGPGGQHCYTTGLLYHHLINGDPYSRDAVLKLARWITHVYEYGNSGGIFDFLLAVKNHNRTDLKNVFTGRYPLDRGTANYIHALLDTYELTLHQSTLKQVEHIIANTVNPADDLDARDLDNVEVNWFYTVFLQSMCRYLGVKQQAEQLDYSFYYARDALLHYADWMAANEQPYLMKPDILEFPNTTWTAQDLRKVNVLYLAAYYSAEGYSHYLDKADEIHTYIKNTLCQHESRTYTRILALLMQNNGVVAWYHQQSEKPSFALRKDYICLPYDSVMYKIKTLASTFLQVLSRFSYKRELRWLARRSSKVQNWINFRP